MRLDKDERKIIKRICEKHGITEQQAFDIIKSPMRFIRDKTATIKLDDNVTEEEFQEKTYNFNLPFIGKLYTSYNNYKRIINAKRKSNKKDESQLTGEE